MTQVIIQRLGHLGDGIADGPIYAARMLPGETVTGTLDGTRLTAPRIVTSSDDRVTAPCRHYKTCGGCSVQHASDAFVANWKKTIVKDALAAHGLDPVFGDIHTSPAASRRRASFSGKRTKKGAMVGFHAPASPTLVQVPDCQIITPGLASLTPVLENITVLGASRKGEITLTVTETPVGFDVSVSGGKPMDPVLQGTLAQVCGAGRIARLTWDDETVAQAEVPIVSFDGMPVPIPPGAFLQATLPGEAALRDAVTEIVGGAGRIVDLFAGCGTFALPLARGAEVHAIESERPMLDALDGGWRRATGVKHVTTETRDLFRNPVLPEDLKYDAAVIDPPRAGADAQMRALADSKIGTIAAVSCNPATFARDARHLIEGGYVMGALTIVDQFRWSPHVELVARFDKRHISARRR
jgi:23S rRNA (uracil1939-C5)-methyltransferase